MLERNSQKNTSSFSKSDKKHKNMPNLHERANTLPLRQSHRRRQEFQQPADECAQSGEKKKGREVPLPSLSVVALGATAP